MSFTCTLLVHYYGVNVMNVTAVTDRGWWGGALNDSLNRGHARYIPTRYIPDAGDIDSDMLPPP